MFLVLALTLIAQPKTDYPALKQRLQRGNTAEARAGYEALLKEKNPQVAAFVGEALCLRVEGKYSDALDALDAGIKSYPDDPTLLSRRADLFFFLGKWDDASKDAEAAVRKQDANLLARWCVRSCRQGATSPRPTRKCGGSKTYSDASRGKISPTRNSFSSSASPRGECALEQ